MYLQAVDAFHPGFEVAETFVEKDLLHVCATVESDFLCIGNKSRVKTAKVTFSTAFDCFQFSERRGKSAEGGRCDDVVCEEASEGERTERAGELVVEHAEVDERFAY